MINFAKILYKSTIHLFRGSSTRSLLCCRSWIGSKGKKAIEVVRDVYTLVQKEDKDFLFHGEVHGIVQFVSINSASEAEVITDTKESRKVNHEIN